MITGIINLITTIPPLSLWLIGFGLLAIFLASIPRLWNIFKRRKKQTVEVTKIEGQQVETESAVEFYRTRQKLAAARGTMAQELSGDNVQKLWVAWWTGTSACSHRLYEKSIIKRSPPIDRMILLDPDGDYIESHARIEDRDADEIRRDILHTDELFRKAGVIPLFFNGYIEGTIIADPEKYADENKFSDKAWIRIEPCIPYKDTVNACNYVIYNKGNDKALFQVLVESYKFLWDKSRTRQPR